MKRVLWRSIQIGLGGVAAERYVDDWVVGIEDITPRVTALRDVPPDARRTGLPVEAPYPLPAQIAAVVGAG